MAIEVFNGGGGASRTYPRRRTYRRRTQRKTLTKTQKSTLKAKEKKAWKGFISKLDASALTPEQKGFAKVIVMRAAWALHRTEAKDIGLGKIHAEYKAEREKVRDESAVPLPPAVKDARDEPETNLQAIKAEDFEDPVDEKKRGLTEAMGEINVDTVAGPIAKQFAVEDASMDIIPLPDEEDSDL